jgi:hypothetical protein
MKNLIITVLAVLGIATTQAQQINFPMGNTTKESISGFQSKVDGRVVLTVCYRSSSAGTVDKGSKWLTVYTSGGAVTGSCLSPTSYYGSYANQYGYCFYYRVSFVFTPEDSEKLKKGLVSSVSIVNGWKPPKLPKKRATELKNQINSKKL